MLSSFFGFTTPESPRRPKERVIIPVTLKPGGLSRFGYHSENTTRSRHIALLRAARSEGFVPIIRRLTLISTFSRYRSPRYSRIFKKDQEWLSAYYAAVKELEPQRRGRRSSVRLPSLGRTSPSAAVYSSQPATSRMDDDDDEDDWTDEEDEDYDEEDEDF